MNIFCKPACVLSFIKFTAALAAGVKTPCDTLLLSHTEQNFWQCAWQSLSLSPVHLVICGHKSLHTCASMRLVTYVKLAQNTASTSLHKTLLQLLQAMQAQRL